MVEERAVRTSAVLDEQGVAVLDQKRMASGNPLVLHDDAVGVLRPHGDFVVDEFNGEIFFFQAMACNQHISSRIRFTLLGGSRRCGNGRAVLAAVPGPGCVLQ